ncbi:pantetheine-phosphate adenylyltransferase [Christensenellaceae bacterium OttesenSCG-928-M15]|nr:pantetheine-phosphate adenylyltransferase [Christensenellaceae bacterium OttesenSCG-928-M15]
MKIAVYPGTFDPLTNGHMDILHRACGLFDQVVVAVLTNTSKTPFFSVMERLRQIDEAVLEAGFTNVTSSQFEGLLVDFTRNIGAGYIIRGLRAVMDFEYELQIDAMNRKLRPDVDTVYFMADPEHMHISSSLVREIGSLGGDIEGLVPDSIKNSVKERLNKQ